MYYVSTWRADTYYIGFPSLFSRMARGVCLVVFLCFVQYFPRSFVRGLTKGLYTNTWVVYTEQGKEYVDRIARERGFINHGQQGGLEGYYLLEHKRVSKRTRRSLDHHTEGFLSEPHIKYAEQQKILSRQKRGYFSDPMFKDQWYLQNTGELAALCCRGWVKFAKAYDLKAVRSGDRTSSFPANESRIKTVGFFSCVTAIVTRRTINKNLNVVLQKYRLIRLNNEVIWRIKPMARVNLPAFMALFWFRSLYRSHIKVPPSRLFHLIIN